MSGFRKKNMDDQLRDWWHKEYKDSVPEEERTMADFALWMIKTHGSDIPIEKKIRYFAEVARKALSKETVVVAGLHIRRNLSALRRVLDRDTGKVKQVYIWDDWRTASPQFIVDAVHFLKQKAKEDVRAIMDLMRAINQDHPHFQKEPFQLSLDWLDEDEPGQEAA